MTGASAIGVEHVQVSGIDLELVRGGAGPTVLLLHGPTAYSPSAPFLGLLGRTASVIAPSHPGWSAATRTYWTPSQTSA